MLMREWCQLTTEGKVVNMALTTRPSGPVMGNFEAAKGLQWVPIEVVSPEALEGYTFYDKRP